MILKSLAVVADGKYLAPLILPQILCHSYSLYRGDEGSRNFVNKRYLRLGSVSNSGVKILEVNSTYYWKPIQGTTLSLCIVLAQDETESRLETVSSKIYFNNIP